MIFQKKHKQTLLYQPSVQSMDKGIAVPLTFPRSTHRPFRSLDHLYVPFSSPCSAPKRMRQSRCSTATTETFGSNSKAISFGRCPFNPEPTSFTVFATVTPLSFKALATRATCPSRSPFCSDDDTRAYPALALGLKLYRSIVGSLSREERLS